MRKAILFLILTLIVLLIGCAPQEKKEAETFYGLKMSFVENAPPETIAIGQKFPIYVDVENFGEWPVKQGKAIFYLQGIGQNLKDYANKLSNSVELVAKKDSLTGKQRLVFANAAYSDLSITNPFTIPMVLTSCYDYATIAEASICISKQSSEICSIEGDKIKEDSNTIGPVKITSLTESVEGNTLKLGFTIANVGNGKVYMPETNCDALMNNEASELTKENYVKIDINDGGQGFKCRLLSKDFASIEGLSGYASLGTVICTKKLSDENYPSIIKISLEYKYVDSVSKSITVMP